MPDSSSNVSQSSCLNFKRSKTFYVPRIVLAFSSLFDLLRWNFGTIHVAWPVLPKDRAPSPTCVVRDGGAALRSLERAFNCSTATLLARGSASLSLERELPIERNALAWEKPNIDSTSFNGTDT